MMRPLPVPFLFLMVVFISCEPPMNEQRVTDTAATLVVSATDTVPTATIDTSATAAPGPVTVTLSEFRIDMSDTLPAGSTTFQIQNVGKVKHNFEIEGQGIEEELEKDLGPGESGTLIVDLKPGTYRVYCPVRDHATKRGMARQLTVR